MTSTTGRPQGQPSALACDGNQALTLNRLIRDARGLTTSEKAFLWCIVSHTNAETGVAYPGLRLLQEELGMSRPGLLKVIDRLTQLGCLGVEVPPKPSANEYRWRKQRAPGRDPYKGSTTRYRINHEALATIATPEYREQFREWANDPARLEEERVDRQRRRAERYAVAEAEALARLAAGSLATDGAEVPVPLMPLVAPAVVPSVPDLV